MNGLKVDAQLGTVHPCWNPSNESPNRNSGQLKHPEFAIIHYTAALNAAGSISWLKNPAAKASAHFVIAQDGTITQLVKTTDIAWHAGKSAWRNLVGLNSRSIGFELANPGILTKRADGKYYTSTGVVVPPENVIEAAHKNGGPVSGWHVFTPEQIEATANLIEALRQAGVGALSTILGHDDIAPGRKTDPGPAFPMDSFRSRLENREQSTQTVTTTTLVNVRGGPGTDFPVLSWAPVPEGRSFIELARKGDWVQVVRSNDSSQTGWIHGNYLR